MTADDRGFIEPSRAPRHKPQTTPLPLARRRPAPVEAQALPVVPGGMEWQLVKNVSPIYQG